MLAIILNYQFAGIPSNEDLAVAFEQAPSRVAPYTALQMPIQVQFLFTLLLFAEPTQDEVQDLSARIQTAWKASVEGEQAELFKTSGLMVQAKLFALPDIDTAQMN